MRPEKPVEIQKDWGHAMKGLTYWSGGMGVALTGIADGVSYGLTNEHASLVELGVTGMAGILCGAIIWFDTWSLREKGIYKNWPYNLSERFDDINMFTVKGSVSKEGTLFQLMENM